MISFAVFSSIACYDEKVDLHSSCDCNGNFFSITSSIIFVFPSCFINCFGGGFSLSPVLGSFLNDVTPS